MILLFVLVFANYHIKLLQNGILYYRDNHLNQSPTYVKYQPLL